MLEVGTRTASDGPSRGIDQTSGGQEQSKLSQTVRNQRLLVPIALEAGTLAYCRRERDDNHRILRNPERRPAARLKSYLVPKGGIERLWPDFACRFAPREIRWPRAELNHGYSGAPNGYAQLRRGSPVYDRSST